MFHLNKRSRGLGLVCAIAATALVLASCSSGSEAASTTSATLSAEAQKSLDAAFEGVGGDLGDLSPVTPTKGKNLYVVSCGEQVPSCADIAAAVKTAGETVGWTATVADGKLSPEGFATAIRQAIAGGADVIVPIGIGCGVAQAAFQEAVNAGITVIGGGGVDDCDPKLWASERLWLADYTPQQMWEEFGKLQADYAYGKTNGDAKAVALNFTTQTWGKWITDGFKARMSELGGEVLTTVDISDPENADGSYVQKVTTALLANPDANVLVGPVDGWFTNGLSAAIVSAGLDERLLVVGRGGDAPALDLIRQGNSGLDATIGFATLWGAWGSIDTALRVLAGEKPVYIGESIQAIDADHNMPAGGQYEGDVDYESKFKAAWGA